MDRTEAISFLDAEISRLQQARMILAGTSGSSSVRRRRRQMSAEARKRISDAQKKRWALRKRSGR